MMNLHESLRLHVPKCLSHGLSAYSEPRSESFLAQAIAGLKLATHYGGRDPCYQVFSH